MWLPQGQAASSPQGLPRPLLISALISPSIYVSGSRQCGNNQENEDGSREVLGCEGTKQREENPNLHSLLVLTVLFSKNRQPAEGLCNFWWAWQMACWLDTSNPALTLTFPDVAPRPPLLWGVEQRGMGSDPNSCHLPQ